MPILLVQRETTKENPKAAAEPETTLENPEPT